MKFTAMPGHIYAGLAIGRLGIPLAAQAMFRLNRAARANRRSQMTTAVIYSLKNAFVRMLYERGHCVRLVRHDQVQECWHTRAFNEGWTDHCEKCDNTGEYRRFEMYRFTFVVDETHYSWHQPVELVDYPVTETGEQVDDWNEKMPGEVLGEGDLYRYAWTVWWCLRLNGYRTFPPLGLYGPPNLTADSFRMYAHRYPEPYFRRPWGVELPFLFAHLSGNSGDKRLSIEVQWPYVVEVCGPGEYGPMMAWSPGWVAAGIGYEWDRQRKVRMAYFHFRPWGTLKRWVRDRLEAIATRRAGTRPTPTRGRNGCGCLDADEYECWRKRHHLPYCAVDIEEDEDPCECECHYQAEDWEGEEGDGHEMASPSPLAPLPLGEGDGEIPW